MAQTEHFREAISQPLTAELLEERAREGWKPVAIEWQRPGRSQGAGEVVVRSEVPYGLEISDDCLHLVENAPEIQVMTLILELIVDDHPLSYVAAELNRKEFTTRSGRAWTQSAVFNLLPRLTEVAPDIFATQNWSRLRSRRFLDAV